MGAGGSTPAPPAGVKVLVKQKYQAYLPQHINKTATLTPEKVKLVHEHWNFIADENDIGMLDARTASRQSRISVFYDAFYDMLFLKAPSARDLFHGNMVRQSRALVKMVSCLCNLEVTENLIPRLEMLADRHVEYGCLPAHYEAGAEALLHAVRAATRDQDPKETERFLQAWDDLFSFVCLIVIPRTAMRLEENARGAGKAPPVLRASPTSGTKLKKPRVKAPSPRTNPSPGGASERDCRGYAGSPRSVIEKMQSFCGVTSRASDGVWVSAGEEEEEEEETGGAGVTGRVESPGNSTKTKKKKKKRKKKRNKDKEKEEKDRKREERKKDKERLREKDKEKRTDGAVVASLPIRRSGSGSWTRGIGSNGDSGNHPSVTGVRIGGGSGPARSQSVAPCSGGALGAMAGTGPRLDTSSTSSPRESYVPSRTSSIRTSPSIGGVTSTGSDCSEGGGESLSGASMSSIGSHRHNTERRRKSTLLGGLVKLGGARGGVSRSMVSQTSAPLDRSGKLSKVEATIATNGVGGTRDAIVTGAGGGRSSDSQALQFSRGKVCAVDDSPLLPASPTRTRASLPDGRPWEDGDVSTEKSSRNAEIATPRSLSAVFLARPRSGIDGENTTRPNGRPSRPREESTKTRGGAASMLFGNNRGLLRRDSAAGEGRGLNGTSASRPRHRRWALSRDPVGRCHPEDHDGVLVAQQDRPPPMPRRYPSRRSEPLRLQARAQAFVKNFSHSGSLSVRRPGTVNRLTSHEDYNGGGLEGRDRALGGEVPPRDTSCVPRAPTTSYSEGGLPRLDEEEELRVECAISSSEELSDPPDDQDDEHLDRTGSLSPSTSSCAIDSSGEIIWRTREKQQGDEKKGEPSREEASQESKEAAANSGCLEDGGHDPPPPSPPAALSRRHRAKRAGSSDRGDKTEVAVATARKETLEKENSPPHTPRDSGGECGPAREEEARGDEYVGRPPPGRQRQGKGQRLRGKDGEGLAEDLPGLLLPPLPPLCSKERGVDSFFKEGASTPDWLAPASCGVFTPRKLRTPSPAARVTLSPSGSNGGGGGSSGSGGGSSTPLCSSPIFAAAAAAAASAGLVVKAGADSDRQQLSPTPESAAYRRTGSFCSTVEGTPPLWQPRRSITPNSNQ